MSETPEERARRELAEGAPPSLVAGYLCCEIHQDLDDPGTCEDCIDFISRLAANDALERAAQKAEQHITDVPHYPGQVVAPSERVSNETAAEIAAAIRGLKAREEERDGSDNT